MHTLAPWSHPAFSSRLVLDGIWLSPKIKFTFCEERFFFISLFKWVVLSLLNTVLIEETKIFLVSKYFWQINLVRVSESHD